MIGNTKTQRILIVSLMMAGVALIAGRSVNADVTVGDLVNLGPVVNTSGTEVAPSISADGLSLYFTSDRGGGQGGQDIWVTTRSSVDDPWGPPVNLGAIVNSSSNEMAPCISADGLELYFTCDRAGGYGELDLWVTTRATRADPWGIPVNLGPTVNSPSPDGWPSISSDGLSLYFGSVWRPGGLASNDNEIWVTTRATLSDPWGPPVNLGSTVNRSEALWPSISADGLALFFDLGGHSLDEILMTRRATVSDPWGPPVKFGPPVNTLYDDGCSSISADGRTLYFYSNRPDGYGGGDLWQASIIPIVDFNGDGIVDIGDLVKLIERWGTNETLCDIAPMPWGDGKVDRKDLEVLMSYWGQEVEDSTLVAWWALDESQGNMAIDSLCVNNATLYGNPVWRPAEGKVDGALQFDGIDDYVKTASPSVVNPGQGAFSVLAWVKGGAPGQVIFSQMVKANWLSTDASTGCLMTELKAQGSSGTNLQSPTVVTDGNWHRVGLTWDGNHRTLYVDDVEVARDTQPSLPGVSTALYIGAGSKLSKGTFWSGLIDDVRIYNRAVTP
jgi:hypothetical protein